jgi:CHASE2 domain-containing sensor protein
MRNNKVSILADIASAILAATRERRATINDWYLSDSDYDVYAQASRALCGGTTMKICGASIHRLSSAPTFLKMTDTPRSEESPTGLHSKPDRERHY